MKLRWTPQAVAEMEEIQAYLLRNMPHYAQSTMQKLYQGAKALRFMPNRGHAGVQSGTLEIVLLPIPFAIIYRVYDNAVEILGFRHTSRDRVIH